MAGARTLNGRSTADDVVAGVDLHGRRVIVTGANTGIGFETARALASAGATVIVACRDEAKCAATAARIRDAHGDVDLVEEVLDLASFRSICAFADRLGDAQIDALVCNAGLAAMEFSTTEDGVDCFE